MKKQEIAWWKKSVVYHIFLRSFKDSDGDGIGDIRGIIEKLDYLENLGVEVLWISPINDSPQVDSGYDVRDYYSVYPPYGTMQDLEELIDQLHSRNMKLLLDIVINHTSDEHPWFQKSRSSLTNPYRDYYFWRDESSPGQPPNKWQSIFGGSAWKYDPSTNQYYLHLFHTKQPDLNWDYPPVRKSIYKMLKFWLDKGIDGFRLDAIFIISKDQSFPEGIPLPGTSYTHGSPHYRNGPRVHEFLQEMNEEVFSHYDILTAGEAEEVTPQEAQILTDPRNKEINLVLPFEHIQSEEKDDKWLWRTIDVLKFKSIISKWHEGLEDAGWIGLYWTSHDIARSVTRFGNDSKEYRIKSAKMLATSLYFLRATLFIMQGEEIGMTNVPFESLDDFPDIETQQIYKQKRSIGWSHEETMIAIRRKSRDNSRTPMQWDSSHAAGFTSGTPWTKVNPNYTYINTEESLQDSESIFYHYKKLIEIRKQNEMLLTSPFKLLLEGHSAVFAYLRYDQKETILVLCNFSESFQCLENEALPEEIKKATILITNRENAQENRISLEPYEATVYQWNQ